MSNGDGGMSVERSVIPAEQSRLVGPKVISSFCSADEGQCVEVEVLEDGNVAVTDSKDPVRAMQLQFTPTEWDAFVLGVKSGEFDYARLADLAVGVDTATPAEIAAR